MTVKIFDDETKAVIYRRLVDGQTVTEVAKMYNTSTRTIGRIRSELEQQVTVVDAVKVEPAKLNTVGTSEPGGDAGFMYSNGSLLVWLPVSVAVANNVNTNKTFTDKTKIMEILGRLTSADTQDELKSRIVEEIRDNAKQKLDELMLQAGITYNHDTGFHEVAHVIKAEDETTQIQLQPVIVKRIESEFNDGKDATRWAKFAYNVCQNPSFKARQEIYSFILAADIEVNEDGNLICFKKVNADFTDVRTGTFDNSPGKYVSELREKVCDDSNQLCAPGLHVCSKSYLSHYNGARTVMCIVDPANVVSIPADYYTTSDGGAVKAKMRTCGYYVKEELSV